MTAVQSVVSQEPPTIFHYPWWPRLTSLSYMELPSVLPPREGAALSLFTSLFPTLLHERYGYNSPNTYYLTVTTSGAS